MGTKTMATETAGAIVATKIGAVLGAGVLGALLIAAVDPGEAMPDPKKRRRLIFTQVVAGMVVCVTCGPFTVSWLGKPDGWFPVAQGDLLGYLELAMPVGLILGALSWGLIGAAVKLRQIIADRGAQLVAGKVGMTDQKQEGQP